MHDTLTDRPPIKAVILLSKTWMGRSGSKTLLGILIA